jgi:hypothetical protein
MRERNRMPNCLADTQIDRFIEDGFVKIEGAFPKDIATQARSILWKDTGCDPDDPATWIKPHRFDETAHHKEVLATGESGTVYLCHPFLVHAAQPHRGTRPRFMAQPPLLPSGLLSLHRASLDYSPVEMAIRQALDLAA